MLLVMAFIGFILIAAIFGGVKEKKIAAYLMIPIFLLAIAFGIFSCWNSCQASREHTSHVVELKITHYMLYSFTKPSEMSVTLADGTSYFIHSDFDKYYVGATVVYKRVDDSNLEIVSIR